MLVPCGYAALMEPGNPDDPLLRQVLPLPVEGEPNPGFSLDPVGDRRAALAPGLLQKYRGRALMVSTPACAIHCRYCFRRHYPYAHQALSADGGAAAIAAIAADPTITEVILSGGDPLMLDDETLAALIGALSAIPHLERLRIHTRLPVVLPARITPQLCQVLVQTRLRLVVVIHANHPRELSAAAGGALDRLRGIGAVLLNQSVLLRGVNDAPDTLSDLSVRLFHYSVLPYYLHLLDRVQGAAHFEVPEEEASRIMSALRVRLPGYLVPRLVREEAGTATKIPIA
jgi:EF-P beta-lysylation protein EpmB